MSRMILFLAVAVVLFSVAAGGSWYLQQLQAPPEETPKTADEHGGTKAKNAAAASKAANAEAPPSRGISRPAASPEAERLAKMAESMQQQQEAVKKREQHLVEREKQLGLIHEQIKGEHRKLDAARKEIDAQLALVQEKLDMLEKRSGAVDKAHKDAEGAARDLDQKVLSMKPLEVKGAKQSATYLDSMEPDAAARSILQMVEKGEMDYAVSILTNMRARQAAGVLTALESQDNGTGTAAQLLTRVRYIKMSETLPK